MKRLATLLSLASLFAAAAAGAQALPIVRQPSPGAVRYATFLVDAQKLRGQSEAQAKAHLAAQLAPFGLLPAYLATDFNTTPIVTGIARGGVGQLWSYDHGFGGLQTVEAGPEGLTLDRGVKQLYFTNFRTPLTTFDPYDPGHDVHVHFDRPVREFGMIASFTSAAGGQLITDTLVFSVSADTDHDGVPETYTRKLAPRVDVAETLGVSVAAGFTDVDFTLRYAYGGQGAMVANQIWYLEAPATAGVDDAPREAALACAAPSPSPSRSASSVRFTLPVAGRAVAQLYDANGRLVRTLLDEWAAPGPREARWDGHDANGAEAVPGVYFVRIAQGGRSATRKLVRVR